LKEESVEAQEFAEQFESGADQNVVVYAAIRMLSACKKTD
jgi:hypothetical protein